MFFLTFSVRIDKIFIRQRTFSSNRKNSVETEKCILYTLQEGRDKKDKKEVKWQKKTKKWHSKPKTQTSLVLKSMMKPKLSLILVHGYQKPEMLKY